MLLLVLIPSGRRCGSRARRRPPRPRLRASRCRCSSPTSRMRRGMRCSRARSNRRSVSRSKGRHSSRRFPRLEAQQAIARQRPGNPRLDETGAKLLAAREGIQIILLGGIAKTGDTAYELTVRAVDHGPTRPLRPRRRARPTRPRCCRRSGSSPAGIRRDLGDAPPANAATAYSETFTAGSLEAMREYSIAQGLALNRRDEEAIPHYQAAVSSDPNFGRAYAGWAVSAFTIGRRDEAEAQWKKAVALIGGMTERERHRTLGSYHLGVSRNYPEAIQQYQEIVKKYPADTAGHSNLAVAHFYMLEFPPAFEEGRKAMTLQPGSYRFASNYALYAMYAGEFEAAARQSAELIQKNPERDVAYVPLAIAQIASGKLDEARQTYERMAALPSGASVAAMGLADLAMWQGRYAEAIALLEPAAEKDVASKNTADMLAAEHFLALAEAQAASGNRGAAYSSVKRALSFGKDEDVLLPASREYWRRSGEKAKRAISPRNSARRIRSAVAPTARSSKGSWRYGPDARETRSTRSTPPTSSRTSGSPTSTSGSHTWKRADSSRPFRSWTERRSAAAKRRRSFSTIFRRIGCSRRCPTGGVRAHEGGGAVSVARDAYNAYIGHQGLSGQQSARGGRPPAPSARILSRTRAPSATVPARPPSHRPRTPTCCRHRQSPSPPRRHRR